ncbi:MAG: tRNA (guanosine(46)-N7)-methyltransferase TrmB [Gammaproteobacteria bacterium]
MRELSANNAPRPPALPRSYTLRGGRITAAQKRALEILQPRYAVAVCDMPDWDAVFGRRAPLALEIGSGHGEAAAHFAAAHPQYNYAILEVHPPGVGALLNKLAAADLQNVRIIQADAAAALPRMFAGGSLHCARIFFPDPWPKKRHRKRRLINAAFAELLAQKTAPGGMVHLATDWADYARQIKECFSAHPDFDETKTQNAPARPPTRFAARAKQEKRAAEDMVFIRKRN